jgi:hypothetical protein
VGLRAGTDVLENWKSFACFSINEFFLSLEVFRINLCKNYLICIFCPSYFFNLLSPII